MELNIGQVWRSPAGGLYEVYDHSDLKVNFYPWVIFNGPRDGQEKFFFFTGHLWTRLDGDRLEELTAELDVANTIAADMLSRALLAEAELDKHKKLVESLSIDWSVRPIVRKFALEMERKMRINDSKGGWDNCTYKYLFSRLKEETEELSKSTYDDTDTLAKAADVANCAIMIAYNKSNEPKEVRNTSAHLRHILHACGVEHGPEATEIVLVQALIEYIQKLQSQVGRH